MIDAAIALAGVVVGALLGAWVSKGVRKKELMRQKAEEICFTLSTIVADYPWWHPLTMETVEAAYYAQQAKLERFTKAMSNVITLLALYGSFYPADEIAKWELVFNPVYEATSDLVDGVNAAVDENTLMKITGAVMKLREEYDVFRIATRELRNSLGKHIMKTV